MGKQPTKRNKQPEPEKKKRKAKTEEQLRDSAKKIIKEFCADIDWNAKGKKIYLPLMRAVTAVNMIRKYKATKPIVISCGRQIVTPQSITGTLCFNRNQLIDSEDLLGLTKAAEKENPPLTKKNK